MSAGKGPGVAQGYRTKQWENAKLWKNFKKDKNKIIFIDERDDIPQEVFEQIVMNRSKAMSDVVRDLMNTIDELNIKNNDLEKENAELKEAAREMLDLLVQNAPIEGLYLSSIDEWNCLIRQGI